MSIDYGNIGERIRFNRIKNKMSQEQLAELANISSVHIGYIERADELLAGSLIVSSTQREQDDFTVLFDCSKEEYAIITQCMECLKAALRGYRITK